MFLGILGWLVVGTIIGFIASKLVNLHGDDPRAGVIVAALGALVLGFVYTIISGAGVTAFNVVSLLFAAIGAAAGSTVWHLVRSKFVSRKPQSIRRSY